MGNLPKPVFPIALFSFQILLLGLYAGYVDYAHVEKEHARSIYPQFQDVHVMIFIGFGFLMTFLKKYGFGAVSYNLLISAVVIQWATLLNAWVSQRVKKEEGTELHNPTQNITTQNITTQNSVTDIQITMTNLMTGDFTAAAVLITYGAILGKANRLQLLVIAIIECIFFAVNETVIAEYLHISDAGGSIFVHLFGAYFGLAVSAVLQNSGGGEHENEGSVYHSDLFAMIGTLFLWVFWPSFNAGLLGDEPNRQNRAIVNTYFALAACVCTTFCTSVLLTHKFKLNMVHIQNATLAGGVAVGTSADLMIKPWGAILIGMIAGILSTIGYQYITPFMSKKLRIHDTCGVNNLHGMPAIFAGIAGAIAAATIDKADYPGKDFSNIYSQNRSLVKQGGYQFAAVCVSFAFAVVGGIITGLIVKGLGDMEDQDLYNDDEEFEVPEPENVYTVNGNNIEMKSVQA